MGTTLATVTLRGRNTVTPGIPDDNIKGDLIAEPTALIFRAERGNFSLAIPWEQIQECPVLSGRGDDWGAVMSRWACLGLVNTSDYLIALTWYSVENDLDMTVAFFVANAASKLWEAEKMAKRLAKAIWEYRSIRLKTIRSATTINYR